MPADIATEGSPQSANDLELLLQHDTKVKVAGEWLSCLHRNHGELSLEARNRRSVLNRSIYFYHRSHQAVDGILRGKIMARPLWI